MSNRPSAKESRNGLAAVAASSRRSPLFYWMVEQHDELVRLSATGGFSWSVLCSVAAELKLSDKKGQTPSLETARKTWRRVRAYVRQRQPTPPSPVPVDQVEMVPPMRSTVPMGPRAAPVFTPPSASVVPAWMPADRPDVQSVELVPSGLPRTGLNRMGETPEEAARRMDKNISAVRRSVHEAGGLIPPRKV